MPPRLINAVLAIGKGKGKHKGVFSRNFKKKPEPLPGNDGPGASGDTAPPERTNEQPSQQVEQALTLWEQAAKSLKPEDRDKLDVVMKSKREGSAADPSSKGQKSSDADGGDSLTDDVNRVITSAQRLKDQDEKTWRPVSSIPNQRHP
jgi:hypothetical protein